jgi:hypothetical protein
MKKKIPILTTLLLLHYGFSILEHFLGPLYHARTLALVCTWYEVVLVWHQFHTKSQLSQFKKTLPRSLKPIFEFGSNFSIQKKGPFESFFGPQVCWIQTLTWDCHQLECTIRVWV